MKTRFYAFAIAGAMALGAMTACSNNGGDDPVNQPETSSYWSDAYRQKQLNGKVKTVKTFENGSTRYNYLEFDANGNLLKNGDIIPANNDAFSGYTFSYDAQNRLTKVVENSGFGDIFSNIELGYAGTPHSVYIPTNYYDMMTLDFGDLRLQKGVTSMYYAEGSSLVLDIKCTSVSGNRLTFSVNAGKSLTDIFGNFDNLEADCQGNFITNLKFMIGNTLDFEERTTLGQDGMPVKIEIIKNNNALITEFATIAGFLLRTKMYASDNSSAIDWQYNDKGYLIDLRLFKNGALTDEASYSYEYDSHGNWTKQVETWTDGETNTYTREYTYW